jgi:diguanylate cyclase (GGDEF)-like protein
MKKSLKQPIKKAINLFLIFFLAIGALMAGSVALIYQTETTTFLSKLKEQEWYTIDRQRTAIGGKFDAIVGDLLFISLQNELHSYLELGRPQVTKAMQSEYMSISATKKIYDQIRYLNAEGMEKVRVNYNAGNPVAVSEEKLQNKSKRYYFTDTFELGEKEVFVSPLDLNVERGKVETPLKPMIRFGTPVFDEHNNKRGVVLLNYLAVNLLDLIEEEQDETQGSKMLVNADGYWLLHPDKEKEWGFMLKERAGSSFNEAYPAEWLMILERRNGQVQTKNGLYTFATIYPLQEGYRSSSGSGEAYKPSIKDLDPQEYFWVLVSYIPSDLMNGYTRKVMSRLFMIGAGLFILISCGAWQLALAITRRRIYQAQLVQMATTDPLTGLPNRKLFFDRLEECIAHVTRHGRKLTLLYIDLDGFKCVNDTLGHEAGDELLIKVGDVLEKNLRKSDIIARLGGDEFAIILFEINELEDARLVGEKVVAMLSQPFELKAGTARIGGSVGAAVFPDHAKSAKALVKRSDTCMYKAKEKGKNTCVLDTKLIEKSRTASVF